MAVGPTGILRQRNGGRSIVWLLPLIALDIGGWLAWKTINEKGPTITITFQTADGLETGKTKVRYRSVDIGIVKDIDINEDTSGVIVTAEMEREAERHPSADTRFWVVRPRLGAGGVSGLETLVSAAFIEVDPGPGEPQTEFTGLEAPPVLRYDAPGKEFVLVSDTLGSVATGTRVYFRQIKVGEVLGYELTPDIQSLFVHIFVAEPYDILVRRNSRFWKFSGFELTISADGIQVKTESLEALLLGGIAFDNPREDHQLALPSGNDSSFRLYDNFEKVTEAEFTEKDRVVMYFDGSLRGLTVGAPVEFLGIKIGRVSEIRIFYDPDKQQFLLPVYADLEPERVPLVGTPYDWDDLDDERTFRELIGAGLRAQLQVGSLLTGQLFVEFGLHPDTEVKYAGHDPQHREIPTIPTTLDEFKRSATDLLTQLRGVPFDLLVEDFRNAAQSIGELAGAPQLIETVASLDITLRKTQTLMGDLDNQVVPLIARLIESLRETSQRADSALAQAQNAFAMLDERSTLRFELSNTLQEAAAAARSIRELANDSERQPDALLRGRGGSRKR